MALRANDAHGQFFMNAADTTTKGVDIVASLDHSFADSSTLRLVLSRNGKRNRDHGRKSSLGLAGIAFYRAGPFDS